MKILIVDDSKIDRKTLRKVVSIQFPECIVKEASNLDELKNYLLRGDHYDLLFQDISFRDGEENPDSDGLDALYDVVNDFPRLPIVIFTGYYLDKVQEFHDGFLGRAQIVGYLDKGTYNANSVSLAFKKAEEYIRLYDAKEGEFLAAVELLEEQSANEADRIEEKVNEEIGDIKKQAERAHFFSESFNGDNWKVRIEAEKKIMKGICTYNAMRLCIEIEKYLGFAFKGCKIKYDKYLDKVYWLFEHEKIISGEYDLIKRSYFLRNKIFHDGKKALPEDGRLLLKTHTILKRIS